MLKTYVAITLLGSALLAGPALAQSSESSGAANASSANWLTQIKPDEWRASKLKGLSVYNNNDEKIGDISELIMSKDGKIEAVVIGVGGFLGIGQHDVAVPLNQIKFVDEPRKTAANTAGNRPSNTTGAGSSGAGMAGGGATPQRADHSYPDHALLNMTKDQLKAAPEFKSTR
jgi:sporulation protein YlmC with PRC-barrel domain